jgi:hypothetical protein
MTRISIASLALSALLASAAALAQTPGASDGGGPNCWAANVTEPTSSEGLPIGHPSYRPLHAAMDVAEAMLRGNPGLLAMPEVRLRFKRAVNDAEMPTRMPRTALLQAFGFGPKTWGRGECEVIPQAAERLAAKAGIAVFFNNPFVALNRWEHDDQLTTYVLADSTTPHQGWPTFGHCAVLTPERRMPWVPVTVGEMLGVFERQQLKHIADYDREHAEKLQPSDLAAAEREAERLRPLNAKAADALLLGARTRKDGEARYHAGIAKNRQMLVAELDDLRRTRDAMGAGRLSEPYHVGSGRHRLPAPMDAKRTPTRVVKLDPSYPWDGRNRTRIQMVAVCASDLERNPQFAPLMRQAINHIDFARLASLLN